VLAYRAFYAVINDDLMFLVYGIFGVLLFVALGYLFYYGRVFAGGDAKLLMGLGGVLPARSVMELFTVGFGFIIALFTLGAVYTIVYSLVLVSRDWKKFCKDYSSIFRKSRKLFLVGFLIAVVIFVMFWIQGEKILLLLPLVLVLLPMMFVYAKAVEKTVMIKLVKPESLQEGDWLEKDVRVSGKVIRKSVHGLLKKEIALLKRARKSVVIKDGVPFTPAFVFAFIAFALWYFVY